MAIPSTCPQAAPLPATADLTPNKEGNKLRKKVTRHRLFAGLGVAAMASVLVATSVGAFSAPAVSAPESPMAVNANAVATAADVAAYQQLINLMYGTPTQRLRAEKLLTDRLNKGKTDCMTGKGFRYQGRPLGKVAVAATPGDLDLIAPLGDFAASRGLLQSQQSRVPVNQGYFDAVAAGQKDAYLTAVISCTEAVEAEGLYASPAERAADAGDQAQADQLYKLTVDFENEVAALQATSEAQAKLDTYRGCLAGKGFRVQSWSELYASVNAKFGPNIAVGSVAWTTAVGTEVTAGAADVVCRSDLRNWAIASLKGTGVIDRYAANPNVASLAAGWAKFDAEYVAAGLK